MKEPGFNDLGLHIARARVVLSLLAMLSLYIDPSAGGLFHFDTYVLITLLAHLVYSLVTYLALRQRLQVHRLPEISIVLDLVFATAIALLCEGPTSPSYVFFVFAIVAVGFRTGFRGTLSVTICCVALYLVVIAFSAGVTNSYMMRAVYLAIAGYLIGFFGQQRAKFEARMRELETKAARQTIARSLHDGYVQALAGVNLRLETCRELLAREQAMDAMAELTELQRGVAREYDEVRAYIRSLAEIDRKIAQGAVVAGTDTCFKVQVAFAARGLIVEQVIQIMLEGMRNAWRHGQAGSVTVNVGQVPAFIRITIDDDGIGFSDPAAPPWTIASRVAEFGGRLRIAANRRSGAHLEVEMPSA